MKRIIWIAKNNVEVQTIYFDEKVNGKEVVVAKKIYGQLKIDDEIKIANDSKIALDVLNVVDEKAKWDVKLAELAKIQIEMDKKEE